jgi:hypothetical protein
MLSLVRVFGFEPSRVGEEERRGLSSSSGLMVRATEFEP